MKCTDIEHLIRAATAQDAHAITQIYKLVQIDPGLFLELAESPGDKAAPLKLISTLGGFISPPDESDMALTLQNGRVLVFERDEKVRAYFRIITDAEKVHQELCSVFQIDPDIRVFGQDSFTDWSGRKENQAGKVLRKVHWINQEQAVIAFNAAVAGLENRNSGKLSWGVDLAVHPQSRNLGIPRALINRMNSELRPGFQYRVFRIFEILQINGIDVAIENVRSKSTFVASSATPLACTEEELVLNSNIRLRVRWNFWVSKF